MFDDNLYRSDILQQKFSRDITLTILNKSFTHLPTVKTKNLPYE